MSSTKGPPEMLENSYFIFLVAVTNRGGTKVDGESSKGTSSLAWIPSALPHFCALEAPQVPLPFLLDGMVYTAATAGLYTELLRNSCRDNKQRSCWDQGINKPQGSFPLGIRGRSPIQGAPAERWEAMLYRKLEDQCRSSTLMSHDM